ncbi:MAG TPA: hypothetical protein PLV62_02975 [Spirochaetota bacterium]|nr:hypothetical protein [Spirochaetota bacterium]
MVKRLLLLVTGFLFVHSVLYAYRPFATEDAGVAPLGENKLELGSEVSGFSRDTLNNANLSFLMGIGLGKAEILFETPYCITNEEGEENEGLEDFVLAAKVKVAGSNQDTGFTLKTEYAHESGMYGLSGVVSQSFSWFTLHSQCGLISDFDDDGAIFGLGIDFPITDNFSLIIDSFVEHIADDTRYQILCGGIVAIQDTIVLDAALGYSWIDRWSYEREEIAIIGCSIVL